MSRDCGHCPAKVTSGEPDPCLGFLPGAWAACCGHGFTDDEDGLKQNPYAFGPADSSEEMKAALLDAVKDGLPKGPYLLMITHTQDYRGDGRSIHVYPVGVTIGHGCLRAANDIGFEIEWWWNT